MKHWNWWWLFPAFIMSASAESPTLPRLPAKTGQVILVTAPAWTSAAGSLQRYDKVDGAWKKTGGPIAVSLGKTGLAWGRGLQREVESGPQKHEGDGKAPAGIFKLGPAFGYAPAAPPQIRWPYRAMTERNYWVDDPESSFYNQLVTIPSDKPNEPRKFWKSFERMKRDDQLYELGLLIEHNFPRAVKGKGSAIFFHIWREPAAPTVGCTAMARENLLEVLRWLDPRRHPLFVQAPAGQVENIAARGR
jgi:L,D-peptidoglycan transpeptidase YkuD (ErfK/YbiS/YcfS/YnhG family)